MPMVTMRCPHCGAGVSKSMLFYKNGKSDHRSGTCNKCRKPIEWWGENNHAKIVKG